MMRWWWTLVSRSAVVATPLMAGCRAPQSALDPAGPQSGAIGGLTWFLIGVSSLVWVIVVGWLLAALFRRRRDVSDRDERPLGRAVLIGVVATVVILFAMLVVSARTGNRVEALGSSAELTIDVIGQRWWWEARYQTAAGPVVTANEIHLPAGKPVELRLHSKDVIHSFWVPRLHGKIDMTPGHVTSMVLQADEPGVYRGQCAEFCGAQHALMALLVIAQPPEEFDRWLAAQAMPAVAPATDEERRGQEVFYASGCPSCHVVRGSGRAAVGGLGPDLTHLASRRTLAAATIPNIRGALAGWVADPQGVKPGNLMPATTIPPDDFKALLAYLESLR